MSSIDTSHGWNELIPDWAKVDSKCSLFSDPIQSNIWSSSIVEEQFEQDRLNKGDVYGSSLAGMLPSEPTFDWLSLHELPSVRSPDVGISLVDMSSIDTSHGWNELIPDWAKVDSKCSLFSDPIQSNIWSSSIVEEQFEQDRLNKGDVYGSSLAGMLPSEPTFDWLSLHELPSVRSPDVGISLVDMSSIDTSHGWNELIPDWAKVDSKCSLFSDPIQSNIWSSSIVEEQFEQDRLNKGDVYGSSLAGMLPSEPTFDWLSLHELPSVRSPDVGISLVDMSSIDTSHGWNELIPDWAKVDSKCSLFSDPIQSNIWSSSIVEEQFEQDRLNKGDVYGSSLAGMLPSEPTFDWLSLHELPSVRSPDVGISLVDMSSIDTSHGWNELIPDWAKVDSKCSLFSDPIQSNIWSSSIVEEQFEQDRLNKGDVYGSSLAGMLPSEPTFDWFLCVTNPSVYAQCSASYSQFDLPQKDPDAITSVEHTAAQSSTRKLSETSSEKTIEKATRWINTGLNHPAINIFFKVVDMITRWPGSLG